MKTLDIDWDDTPVNGHPAPVESFETAVPVRVEELHNPALASQRRTRAEQPARAPEMTGRTLPHSLEAEEYLLSCCLLDGDGMVERCKDAKITPASFYDQGRHGVLFDVLLHLHATKKPIDVSVVAEELKATRQLDSVGGYPFLAQVSSRIPTTAQAGYFIEKVREQSLLREIIRSATGVVEDCYGFSGGIEEFAADVQARIHRMAEGASAPDVLKRREFNPDPKQRRAKPVPIYSLADTQISTAGNLTTLYSQAKTGKTSLLGAMLAATMTTPTSGRDTLGITGPNYDRKAVVHFDTEQSPYDWEQMIDVALRRAGVTAKPAWLRSYTLTGMSADDARRFVDSALRAAVRAHGGIHSVFIDGVADLVVDPNDAEECFPLITHLHARAIEFNTAIVSVLHMNPGSDAKGRGHLGSQLERKSESNLTMEKSGDTTLVYALKQRGKMITKDRGAAFRWSDDLMMHVSCERESESGVRKGRTPKYEFADFRPMMPLPTEQPKPLPELHRLSASYGDIPRNSLRDLLQREAKIGVLECVNDRLRGPCYRLAAPS